MHISNQEKDFIIQCLENMPPDKHKEVLDFIEFLKFKSQKEKDESINTLLSQQQCLREIWDSKEEDLYEL